MSRYLNARQAAEKMGLSPRTISDLCRNGVLDGAYKERSNGPWLIPDESVEVWLSQNKHENGRRIGIPPLPSWTRNVAIGTILALLLALISATADWPASRKTIYHLGLNLGLIDPYADASEGETLIIVSTIRTVEGIINAEAHYEMKRAIEDVENELEHTNIRVEIDPRTISDDDQSRAASIAEKADASMIIWGSDTGARIHLQFLSLREKDDEYVSAQLSEVHRTQLADPAAYAKFVTKLLPSSTRDLALYSIVQSHSFEGRMEAEIEILEMAAKMSSGDIGPEVQVVFLNRLGNLYSELSENNKAIEAYSQGIKASPNIAEIYHNRAKAREESGDPAGALEDLDIAIELDPSYGNFFARGSTFLHMEDYASSISDFDMALELEPRYAAAYINRGNAYRGQGDLAAAIADFNEVIERYDGLHVSMVAHINLAGVWHTKGYIEKAIVELDKALEIEPFDLESRLIRGYWHRDSGNLEEALADFRIFLNFAPEDVITTELEDTINEIERELGSVGGEG